MPTSLLILISIGLTFALTLLMYFLGARGKQYIIADLSYSFTLFVVIGVLPTWTITFSLILLSYLIYDMYMGGND